MLVHMWEVRLAVHPDCDKKIPADDRRIWVASKSEWLGEDFKSAALKTVKSFCDRHGVTVNDVHPIDVHFLGTGYVEDTTSGTENSVIKG